MQKEVLMIPDANTVINPGAMMVPALNTTVTNIAVVRPWGSKHFAARTYVIRMKILQQMHYLILILEVTWVSTRGHKEAKHDKYPQEEMYYCRYVT